MEPSAEEEEAPRKALQIKATTVAATQPRQQTYGPTTRPSDRHTPRISTSLGKKHFGLGPERRTRRTTVNQTTAGEREDRQRQELAPGTDYTTAWS